MTMDTYSSTMEEFTSGLKKAIKHIPLHKLGVGLITTKGNDSEPFSDGELAER